MRRSNKNKRIIILIILSFIFLVSGIILQIKSLNNVKSKKEEIKKIKKDVKKEYKASLVMVGDALIHSDVYNDALQSDGSYDFKPMLELTKPITTKYDLAYYNQETILGGVSLGLSNYPRFNSPQEVGDAFIDSGFNLVSLASNHTMDKNEEGVLSSLAYWKSKKNVYTAGSYTSFEDRDKVVIKEINGIKYAFLSYTTVTNGLTPPIGKEYLDNVYSEELAKADIERVRDKVDVVMVAMHWGVEYSNEVSTEQEKIANYLSGLGVDIIIGSHPHVIEPVDFIGKTLVIYSLGNYISDQEGTDRLIGLMMSVDIKKVVENKITTITLENTKADLLYTKSYVAKKRNFKVYPYEQVNSTILPTYQSYYEKYKNIIQKRNQNIEVTALGG